jgi:arylsulfatase A-like enzyme
MRILRYGLLLLMLGAKTASAAATASPNFLILFIDDQGLDGTPVEMIPGKDFSHSSAYKMPTLESIASKGVIFSQAYASHPKCEGSRAAYQMGRSTLTLNSIDKWHVNWSAPVTDSLANTLKRANPTYRAAHFGKWQWPQTPASMGYDASDGITMNEDGDTTDPNDPKQSFGITRRAVAFMDQQVKDGHPFYLQLSYYAVHSKPQALAATLKKYSGPNALQEAMTEDLDNCMGVVMKELEKLGIANNTYVIYMSDNGMKTAALKGAKALLDEGGLRVPLVVSGPGIKGQAYSNVPVTGYDIYATVVDLASPGFALPKGAEGGSWRQVLLNGGKGSVTRPIDYMIWHHDVEVPHPQTAIRKGDYKLLYYWDTKQSFLYDLEKDVLESNNLAAQQPALANSLLADIKNHVRKSMGEAKLAELESGKGGDAGGGMAAGGGTTGGGMAGGGMAAGGMAAAEAGAAGNP